MQTPSATKRNIMIINSDKSCRLIKRTVILDISLDTADNILQLAGRA